MAERAARRDPHTAIKHELLVRYLDAWTPTVLRSHHRASYLDASRDGSVIAALRVFAEFADRLRGHELDVVVLGSSAGLLSETPLSEAAADLGAPAGLAVRRVPDPRRLAVTAPVFAHLDLSGEGTLDEATAWGLVSDLAQTGDCELLLTMPPVTAEQVTDQRARLRRDGLHHVLQVELTDEAGRTQLMLFGTGSDRHLAAFKEAMWAADEYAGIRYRDPHDPEHTPVDISLQPPLAPLRRALLAEVSRRGRCRVGDLQQHTFDETIYRPADATRVLTSLVAAGALGRDPGKGRLTPGTLVSRVRQPGSGP